MLDVPSGDSSRSSLIGWSSSGSSPILKARSVNVCLTPGGLDALFPFAVYRFSSNARPSGNRADGTIFDHRLTSPSRAELSAFAVRLLLAFFNRDGDDLLVKEWPFWTPFLNLGFPEKSACSRRPRGRLCDPSLALRSSFSRPNLELTENSARSHRPRGRLCGPSWLCDVLSVAPTLTIEKGTT